uniref:Ribonuclease P/MRP 30 subunit n=1 Tax=Paramormyrops kingsleyae TaxID=1676925 RepID=A0A3B3QX03_9TELE
MVAFADLNISNTNDKKKLQSLIETAAHREYDLTIVFNSFSRKRVFSAFVSLRCLGSLGTSKPIKVLNRLTLMVSDASHFRPTSELKSYDIVAVYPKTEKLFHAACMTFDVDIICVAVTEKQPFHFKRPPVFGVRLSGEWVARGPHTSGTGLQVSAMSPPPPVSSWGFLWV